MSTTRWIFLVSPPQERPIQRSAPFCARRVLMNLDAGVVNHLHVAVIGLHDRIHQAAHTPFLRRRLDRLK